MSKLVHDTAVQIVTSVLATVCLSFLFEHCNWSTFTLSSGKGRSSLHVCKQVLYCSLTLIYIIFMLIGFVHIVS